MRILLLTISYLTFISSVIAQQEFEVIEFGEDHFDNKEISKVCVDTQGNEWIYHMNQGLFITENQALKRIDPELSDTENYYNLNLFASSDGGMWICTEDPNQLFYYKDKELKLIENEIVSKHFPYKDFTENKEGAIILAGKGALIRFYNNEWTAEAMSNPFMRVMQVESYGTSAVYSTTSEIVFKYKNDTEAFRHSGENLIDHNPIDMAFTNDSTCIIAYQHFTEGGFIVKQGNTWTSYNKDNSELPSNMINDIEVDQNGFCWIATEKGLAKFDGDKVSSVRFGDSSSLNRLTSLSINEDTLWIGSAGGLIKYFMTP